MKPADIALAVLVAFVWGSNLTAARLGTFELPPLLLLALRLGVAGLVLAWVMGPARGQRRRLLAIAFTMGTLHFGLLFVAVTRLDAGTAAIVMQTGVPFAALLTWAIHGERLGWRGAAGMVLAFGGIVLMVGEPRIEGNLDMLVVALVSAFFFAVANVQIRALKNVDPMTLNGWIALATAPQVLIASLVLEDGQAAAIAAAGWESWAAIAYMALVVTLLGHGLWYRLVPRYATNQTMPFTLLVPVFGVLCGVAVLGEELTLPILAGGVVTIAGVGLIVLGRRPAARPAAAPGEAG